MVEGLPFSNDLTVPDDDIRITVKWLKSKCDIIWPGYDTTKVKTD